MTEDDLQGVREALAAGRECARRWHGARGEERARELAEHIDRIVAVRAPLSAHCRRGAHQGRALAAGPPSGHKRRHAPQATTDAARVLNREAGEVLKTLRDMGRTHPERKAKPRRPMKRDALDGMLAKVEQRGQEIKADHQGVRAKLSSGTPKTMPNGGVIRSMDSLNEEAAKLLKRLDRVSGQLNRKWQLYAEGHWTRKRKLAEKGKNPYHAEDEYHELEKAVVHKRKKLHHLRKQIVKSAKQSAPDDAAASGHVAGRWWEIEDAMAAWMKWREKYGDWPTRRDLDDAATDLPTYGTLRRLVGPNPITTMVDFVT